MKTKTTPKAETESRTRIQAYSKSQLAGLYLPHIQSASARRTLRSWIAKNTALQAALAQTGYSEKAILLTPAQVRLFFKFLGEPRNGSFIRKISFGERQSQTRQEKRQAKAKRTFHHRSRESNYNLLIAVIKSPR